MEASAGMLNFTQPTIQI